MPDRLPQPAPFVVGQRVRYAGDLRLYHAPTDPAPFFASGSVGVVTRVSQGRRGTGRQLREDGDLCFFDDGEPMLDTTRDGYSVVDFGNGWTRAVDATQLDAYHPQHDPACICPQCEDTPGAGFGPDRT